MTKPNQAKRKSTGVPDQKQQKRSRIQWKKISSSLPKFLDAETSITAAKFGARRLPEMKSLWRTHVVSQSRTVRQDDLYSCLSMKKEGTDTSYFESGGCKTSQRHLRRRTSSHNTRRHHRYSTANMNKEHAINNTSKGGSEHKSRKARRKPSTLKEIHSKWSKDLNINSGIGGSLENNHLSNWLATHLWHTKRFHMSPPLTIYDNWCVPLGHTNRGSKAALRLARSKSTIQDATWSVGGHKIRIESEDRDKLITIVEKVCGGKRHQSALFLLNDKVVSGLEVGFGFFYDLNCSFPSEIIGPGEFMFGKDDHGRRYYCNITVDVTIMKNIKELCHKVVQDLEDVTCETKTLAVLKVRGLEATAVLNSSILDGFYQNENDLELQGDWTKIVQDRLSHVKLKNRTIFHLTSKKTNRGITLISQCPNEIHDDKSRNMNIGVSGWDLWCDPKIASQLFMSLNQNGACSIGLIESATIAMEANPPIPLWPRDYPDSQVGIGYWSCDSPEWNLIRYCFEAGMEGGRIKTEMHRLIKKCPRVISGRNLQSKEAYTTLNETYSCKDQKVSWQELNIAQSGEDEESRSIIVIKGSFVTPFIQSLAGWCPKEVLDSCFSEHMNQPKRRPRRSARDKKLPITLPPLPKSSKEAQKERCSQLLDSLSMFALLRCHITVTGRGTISAGMKIKCYNSKAGINQAADLGFVVAGMFSPIRGAFHGLGFISSRAFLELLSEYEGCLIALDKNERSLVLKVSIGSSDTNTTVGYLQILTK